jgi:hypothetical protein
VHQSKNQLKESTVKKNTSLRKADDDQQPSFRKENLEEIPSKTRIPTNAASKKAYAKANPTCSKATTKKSSIRKTSSQTNERSFVTQPIEKPVAKISSKSATPVESSSSQSVKSTSAVASATKKGNYAKSKKKTFEEDLIYVMFVNCQPYSVKDLAKALGPAATETSVNYCLLSLIDKQWVFRKEFATKSRSKELFWANQECKSKELWNMLQFFPMAGIQSSRKELAALQQQQKEILAELSTVLTKPSNEELTLECQAAGAQIQELTSRLKEVKQRIAMADVPPAQQRRNPRLGIGHKAMVGKKLSSIQLQKKISIMRDEWRQRKVKCMDFIEQLADGMEKKVKDVVKLLELETDEMVVSTMPPKYKV